MDVPARFLLKFPQSVDVPRVEHQWFFADDIGPKAQPEADVCIVEVVGGADAQVVDALALSLHFFEVPIEALELGEKACLREITVDDADGVVFVKGSQQFVSGLLYGLHVAGSDVAGGSDEGEISQVNS